MPTSRSELAATSLDGSLYVAGGIGLFGTTSVFERFDVESSQWQSLASLPLELNHLSAAVLQGKVYVSGGYRNVRLQPDVRAMWRFDPEAGVWKRMANMPGSRGAHAMVASGGRLFVVGGVGADANRIWEYDPESNTWDSSRAPMPTPREHLAVVAAQGKIYAIGGRDGANRNLPVLEIYDIAADQWSPGPRLITPRSGFTAGVIGSRIHVTGGEDIGTGSVLDGHEYFDVDAAGWVAGTPLPEGRHGIASAVLNGKWYVVGGATRAALATFISMSDRLDVYEPAPED